MAEVNYSSGDDYVVEFLGYHFSFNAHDFEEQTTAMECLPESLAGRKFYEPKDVGFEAEIKERLAKMRGARSAPASDPRQGSRKPPAPR